jgi:hypothetical protein
MPIRAALLVWAEWIINEFLDKYERPRKKAGLFH